MAVEKKWLAVSAKPFTSDGTQFGVITVTDTAGFKVKQLVFIAANTKPILQAQVKRVISSTQLIVGPVDNKVAINDFFDVSTYTVALSASIAAPEQDKAVLIPDKDHYQAVYEADPTVADRVVLVDQYGNIFGVSNPLPIAFDGTIEIGSVSVVDSDGDQLDVNPDGSINVNIVSGVTNNPIKNTYAEALAVAAGVETTIVSYVVPLIITKGILQRVSVSGNNVGRYRVFVNGSVVDTRRTYYGGSFNEYFEYSTSASDGMPLNPGDTVVIKILHDRIYVGDFQARIQVLEIA